MASMKAGQPDIERASLRMEKIWTSAEQRIMKDVVRRIRKTGQITSTADYQINRLIEMGKSTEEVERILKDALNATYPEMFELYDKAANWQYVRNKDIYEQVNAEFVPPEENEWLKQVSKAVKEQTKDRLENLSQSYGFSIMMGSKRVFTPFAQYWHQYVDAAIMDIVSGGFDYNTVIRRVVTQMTNSGLRTVDYATGHTNRVDVAARRAVMTGLSQITNQINEQNAAKLGTDYYEVSWHEGARPDHRIWQGKVYTKDQLRSICNLGEVTGLCGANCRHVYYPFIPGISKRMYPDQWLEEQNRKEDQTKEWQGKQLNAYERTQQQRKMETAMRAQREKIDLLKEAGADRDEITLAKVKYQAQLNEYARFSKKMGLPQQRERIYYDMRGRKAPNVDTYKKVATQLESVYNKGNTLENIKIKEKDIELSKYIKSNKLPKTIEAGKQGKHIKEHNNYIEGRSYLTISEDEAQELVNKYAGSGWKQRDSNNRWSNKEIITADHPVGYSVDPVTGEEKLTKKFTIHYSKKGVHIVPAREE